MVGRLVGWLAWMVGGSPMISPCGGCFRSFFGVNKRELTAAKRAAEQEVLSMQREVGPLRALSMLKATALKTHHTLSQRIIKALKSQVGL